MHHPSPFDSSPFAPPFPPKRSLFMTAIVMMVRLAAALAVVVLAVVLWYGRDLPKVGESVHPVTAPSVTFLDRAGKIMAVRGAFRGEEVSWEELPQHLIDAIIVTEDRRFFSHHGFDVRSIVRAGWSNIRSLQVKEGGSTITQQLAKNLFLTPQRTLKRKVQELLLSIALEFRYDKKEIFTAYVNRVYFGAGAWGIGAAARIYFGKDVALLNIYESALLAGLLRAPSRYAPIHAPQEAHGRARRVLLNMVDGGMISLDEAQFLLSQGDSELHQREHLFASHYFIDWLMPEVQAFVDKVQRNVIVETTLDMDWQQNSSQLVGELIEREGEPLLLEQAAVLVMNLSGAVRVMVGGKDYLANRYNRATRALRQPGSAFKLFVYLAALEEGRALDSWMEDQAIDIDGWRPRNFDEDYRGTVSLASAFAQSLNTVAVQLSEEMGRQKVIDMALRFGIEGVVPNTPSVALGTANINLLSLTSAYGMIARGGTTLHAYGIVRMTDEQGAVLYEHPSGQEQVSLIDDKAAETMTAMMRYAMIRGTGRGAYLEKRPAAGKTGTSQNFRDAWFVGFTANYVAGVWVGNDDESAMAEVTGGSVPAQLWRQVMLPLHESLPVTPLAGDELVRLFQSMEASPPPATQSVGSGEEDGQGDGESGGEIETLLRRLNLLE